MKYLLLACLAVVFAGSFLTAPMSAHAGAVDYLIEGGKKQTQTQDNPFFQDVTSQKLSEALDPQYVSQSRNPYQLIGRIIRIVLSFLGIGAVSLMVYAGVMWMTSAGNEDKVSEAKKTMMNAAIGLILILMSYSLTWYVVSRLQRSTNTYGTGGFTETGVQTPTRGLF